MRNRNLKIIVLFASFLSLIGCGVAVKQNALYIDRFNPNDTAFYSASEIYTDYITSEGWFSQAPGCMSATTTSEAAYKGDLGIDIKWDRVTEGCPWLGFGFGWDSWTGKDLSKIKNVAAVQFYVRMVEGERPNIPWAVGLEDFTGSQAWLGVTANSIKAEKITTEWARVEMPLSEFNWDEQGADPSNIKQIIFNTEAEGRMYIDEIKIVPYSGGFRKRANLSTIRSDEFTVDGKMDDQIWKTEAIEFGSNQLHLALMDNFICVALKVKDDNPLQNSFTGKDVYNGDAFEIAFSTDHEVSTKRQLYLSSDQHLGFALTKDGVRSWDWMEERELNTKEFKTSETEDGYVFEAKINLQDLDVENFEKGMLYGLELAVDHGDENGRIMQERWNDPGNAGFHTNPSLWGEMYIMTEPEAKN